MVKSVLFSIHGNVLCLLAVLLIFSPISMSAQHVQNCDTFQLMKRGGHYLFTSDINGVAETTVLLESGISAMLADSSYVFSSGVFSDLELLPSEGEKINLAGHIYRITHKATGVVKISDHTSYRGDVFVLAGFSKGYQVAVPVQRLYNDMDNDSRIVRLVLDENYFQMLDHASLSDIRNSHAQFEMNTDTYLNMPAIRTMLTIEHAGQVRQLEGNFIIDFGNPELVFLMQQHGRVQTFLADNSDIKLRPARNARGEKVGQYILAEKCQLCNYEFSNAVIAVTEKLPRFTSVGNIGLKFFMPMDAVFDFESNKIFLVW